MTEETGRAQDQGRRHRRKGAPSEATLALLTEYHDSMRLELRDTLADLRPKPNGQLALDGSAVPPTRPALTDRLRLWDLAIKLGRELGAEIDPPTPTVEPSSSRRVAGGRRGKVDYG